MNTLIHYLYRDADNYKLLQSCIIRGRLTPKQEKEIQGCLFDGEYFIPHQVGLPEKRFEEYCPEADHCWFEWIGFGLTELEPTIDLSAETLVANFQKANGHWNDTEYPAYGGATMPNATPSQEMSLQRAKQICFCTIQLLRKQYAETMHGDWKDVDDALFSNLDIEAGEVEEIFKDYPSEMVYTESCFQPGQSPKNYDLKHFLMGK